MFYVAAEFALACIGVILGLTFDCPSLLAAMVFSVVNMLVLVRPRRPGLGDDYASMAVALFIAWVGVSLIIEGAEQAQSVASVEAIPVLTALALSALKLYLLKRSVPKLQCIKDHYISDLGVLCIVLVGYVAMLEAAVTMIIGALVMYEAVELFAEAVQEVVNHCKRSRKPCHENKGLNTRPD